MYQILCPTCKSDIYGLVEQKIYQFCSLFVKGFGNSGVNEIYFSYERS